MSRLPGESVPHGPQDEERRRQIARELELAEQARNAALESAAEAQARADLARRHLTEAAASAASAGTLESAITPTSVSAPRRSPTATRSALLDRAMETAGPSTLRRRLMMLGGVLAVGLVLATVQFREPLLAAAKGAVARWVEPRVRSGSYGPAIMQAPALRSSPEATEVVQGLVGSVIAELERRTIALNVPPVPPSGWRTAAYRERPSEYPGVTGWARRLIGFSTSGPAALLSLAEADLQLRSQLAEAGVDSEGLAQEAMRQYGSVQGVLLDRLKAQGELGRAALDFDQLLRAHEGSLSYQQGEYSHPDEAVAERVEVLEASLERSYQSWLQAEAVAARTVSDLGLATR